MSKYLKRIKKEIKTQSLEPEIATKRAIKRNACLNKAILINL